MVQAVPATEQVDLTDLRFVAQAFEHAMRNKNRISNQVAAFARFRRCTDCGNEFQPRRWELCPVCGSEDSHMRDDTRICDAEGCGHKWEPNPENDPCPQCSSQNWEEAPRTSEPLSRQLTMLKDQLEQAKKDVEKTVHELPIWTTWACDVKGLGAMTLGLILSHTDFTRVETATAMWSHAGFGLKERGGVMVPQRKHAGEKIGYDGQLRSVCFYYLAPSLLKAKGPYYEYYLARKELELAKIETGEVKNPGHAHQRALRFMVKLCLEHIWRVQRGLIGLPAPELYIASSFATKQHTGYISPDMMVGRGGAVV